MREKRALYVDHSRIEEGVCLTKAKALFYIFELQGREKLILNSIKLLMGLVSLTSSEEQPLGQLLALTRTAFLIQVSGKLLYLLLC
jgi:hypothetical protein